MSFSVVIPARYASTRLPGKALLEIDGRPMIAHVVDRANESSAHRVIVATDDVRIAEAVNNLACEVCMTQADHESGSDRIAEVVGALGMDDAEIIVNVQGDEPMIGGQLIDEVGLVLQSQKDVFMSTAAVRITQESEIENPNVVKVVINKSDRALYFSRSGIPFARDQRVAPAFRHLGIYGYHAGFLRQWPSLPESSIEQTEKLEQLRVLDAGYQIQVVVVEEDAGIGVDTQEDLDKVRSVFADRKSGA